MAQTPEAKVKAAVVKILKQYGAYYFFPTTGGYGRSGVPDIVGSYRGKFFAIECKAGKNLPTPLQLNEIRAINGSGAVAIVVNEDNLDDVATLLESL
jgi:Holliday junction resolvase